MTSPAIPLDVRVEYYDPAGRLVLALIRSDLIFVAVPHPGDSLNPVALPAPGTGWFFDTTPQVHHIEHYPTPPDGRALGTLALSGEHAHGPGGAVVIHHRRSTPFSDESLDSLRGAGWYVSDFQQQDS